VKKPKWISDQLCLFLARKELLTLEIHNELVAILRPEAAAYSTIAKPLRRRRFPRIMFESPSEPARTIIDDAFLDTFDKQPFSSI
jgi:hypothetical protein